MSYRDYYRTPVRKEYVYSDKRGRPGRRPSHRYRRACAQHPGQRLVLCCAVYGGTCPLCSSNCRNCRRPLLVNENRKWKAFAKRKYAQYVAHIQAIRSRSRSAWARPRKRRRRAVT